MPTSGTPVARPVLAFADGRLDTRSSGAWQRRLAWCAADIEALRQNLAAGVPTAYGAVLPADPHVVLVGRVGGAWRVAPGLLIDAGFATDCADAGFEAGAVVFSLATSEALGELVSPGHYGRVEGRGAAVDDQLEKFAERPSGDNMADRQGYDANFLGIPVPLPIVGRHADVATYLLNGKPQEVLRYTHYSVVMSRSRRLPYFTASNIDGAQQLALSRKEGSGGSDRWYLDPRLDAELQAGPKVYEGSHCDKGHMVRRLDPVWGSEAVARLANDDTFFYTNACPQHRDLNRKVWNDLEDHIYDNAGREKTRVTVFTGPVLAASDVPFRGLQAPTEFWKVVVSVDKGRLAAAGYLQSQVDLLTDLEFAFGSFKTYQIPIAEIERRSGLKFGALGGADTMRGSSSRRAKVIESVQQDSVAAAPEWADLDESFVALNAAIKRYDKPAGAAVLERLLGDIHDNRDDMPQRMAEKMLQNLRANRWFDLMQQLGDALINTGQDSDKVRRQYAQALIDQGQLSAARFVLQTIVSPPIEWAEATGLLGRIDKQLYVNHPNPAGRHAGSLQRAFDSYHSVWATDPGKTWHGINAVAVLARAEHDGVPLAAPRPWRQMAAEVLATLQQREDEAADGLSVWDCATAIEARVALDDAPAALRQTLEYVGMPGASAFELASTARQLDELWRIGDRGEAWAGILTLLRAETLRNQGSVTLSPAALRSDLQKTFGNQGSRSLPWYLNGLKRCKAVARIEQAGKGFGTGWLVDAGDFVPGMGGLLLMTNAHVISPGVSGRHRDALLPAQASANFQGLGLPGVGFGDVVCWSPVDELDYTLLTLATVPDGAEPLPLRTAPVTFAESEPPRLYIIGHPQGRDVEFSLQDNLMLGQNERALHYRTPTEPGSSGSPVFDADEWQVVALHHAGQQQMPRLDGRGRYEANEGIAIQAIRAHARGTAGSR